VPVLVESAGSVLKFWVLQLYFANSQNRRLKIDINVLGQSYRTQYDDKPILVRYLDMRGRILTFGLASGFLGLQFMFGRTKLAFPNDLQTPDLLPR
jgi:hypothetical protein